MASVLSLKVSGIPLNSNADQIENFFNRKVNGGCGDVTSISLSTGSDCQTATIQFESMSTLAKVLRKQHRLLGTTLKLSIDAPICNEVSSVLDRNILSLVNELSPSGFVSLCPHGLTIKDCGDHVELIGSVEQIKSVRDGIAQMLGAEVSIQPSDTATVGSAVGDECVICTEKMNGTNSVRLDECGHRFHIHCVLEHFRRLAFVCPLCKHPYGITKGFQPDGGSMEVLSRSGLVRGHDCSRYLQITYRIPSGIQSEDQPHPGYPYIGYTSMAYLPDTPHGLVIAKLLHMAFNYRLIFEVDQSDYVQFNPQITHKRRLIGPHGYPDTNYLTDVTKQLAELGLTRNLVE